MSLWCRWWIYTFTTHEIQWLVVSAEVPLCCATPCQRELNPSHGPQSTTAQPASSGGTHGYIFSTCRSSLKRLLALKRDSLIVEYAFCFTLKTPGLTLAIPLFSKQPSHGKAGNGRGTAGFPRQALTRLPRAPGPFVQWYQAQGGILECPV